MPPFAAISLLLAMLRGQAPKNAKKALKAGAEILSYVSDIIPDEDAQTLKATCHPDTSLESMLIQLDNAKDEEGAAERLKAFPFDWRKFAKKLFEAFASEVFGG